jgi:pimeloyl-ACP methyl ester carboxylesterase
VIGALTQRTRQLRRRFRRGFRRGLESPDVPLSLDMSSESRTLLVAFGGMMGQIGMPPFEFFKTTGGIPVKRLFVRDLRQAWYHRGIPDHGTTIAQAADSLGRQIAAHDVDRLVVTGNSAGGYAALVFGTLLGADAVLCFAPQTVLDLEILDAMDDHRWDEQIAELARAGDLDRAWTDLRRALPEARCAETRYEVYFDSTFRADRLHAERLSELHGVRLRGLERGEHGMVREMRESGELERVMLGALAPPTHAE